MAQQMYTTVVLWFCVLYISFESFQPFNSTFVMADVQAVISALQVFNGAPDKASLEAASTWLQDFQHSVNYLSPWTNHDQPV